MVKAFKKIDRNQYIYILQLLRQRLLYFTKNSLAKKRIVHLPLRIALCSGDNPFFSSHSFTSSLVKLVCVILIRVNSNKNVCNRIGKQRYLQCVYSSTRRRPGKERTENVEVRLFLVSSPGRVFYTLSSTDETESLLEQSIPYSNNQS